MKYTLFLLCLSTMINAMEDNYHNNYLKLLQSIETLTKSNENQLHRLNQLLEPHPQGNEGQAYYTPWRGEYDKSKNSTAPLSSCCPFCEKFKKDPNELTDDRDKCFVVQEFDQGTIFALNQNPYRAGHSLMIPKEHTEDWAEFSSEQMLEWMKVRTWSVKLLQKFYSEHFNTYVNGGQIGGQSVKHIHENILPRNNEGAINFMCGVHVVAEWLTTTHKRLKKPLNILQQKLQDGAKITIESLLEDDKK